MHGATFDISIDLLEIISRQYCWILLQCNPYKTRLFAFSIYTKWFRMRCIRMQPPTGTNKKQHYTGYTAEFLFRRYFNYDSRITTSLCIMVEMRSINE